MNQILVVDDEKEIAELVKLYLQNEGYVVTACTDSTKAMQIIDKQTFDLAILDIMMPHISGLDLCRHIRTTQKYPIIMLTARDNEMDKVTGLSVGADDYMTKPFLPLELIARVKAQLRRYYSYNMNVKPEPELICGGLVLQEKSHTATLNGKPLSLTPSEFLILAELIKHKGEVISAEKLYQTITGDDYFGKNNNTITVHIRHLREKMNDSFEHPRYIKTVWGCGYKIEN